MSRPGLLQSGVDRRGVCDRQQGKAGDIADLESLKAADLIKDDVKRVRVFLSGEISRAMNVRGLTVTKGAKAAIEAAGGSVEA